MGKKLWRAAIELADDVLAYVLTILGILISNYIPMLKQTGRIDVALDWWRVGLSAVVAFLIVAKSESLDPEAPEASRAGRKRNFGMRMANAISQGIAWDQIMQMVS